MYTAQILPSPPPPPPSFSPDDDGSRKREEQEETEMGSTTTTELGLDLATRTMGALLRKVREEEEELTNMEDYVRSLEEERRKIEAFKRELPLCMLILTHVIDYLREELSQCRGDIGNGRGPVLEQFLPINTKLRREGQVKPDKDNRDKTNWMSSVQLWSDNYSDDANSNATTNPNNGTETKADERNGEPDRQSESGNPFVEHKSKPKGGGDGGGRAAFLSLRVAEEEEEEEEEKMKVGRPPLSSDLSLLTPGFRNLEEHRSCESSSLGKAAVVSAARAPNAQTNPQRQLQCPRKARRCWSPELHRRFVCALQQLGGSQAATPKQIREVMKVDGLTNDEVKSHLQKYRLHTRRMGPSSISPDPALVVLGGGGLWTSSPASKQQQNSPSVSPQSPLHFARAGEGCGEEDDRSESYSWRGGHTHRSEELEECC